MQTPGLGFGQSTRKRLLEKIETKSTKSLLISSSKRLKFSKNSGKGLDDLSKDDFDNISQFSLPEKPLKLGFMKSCLFVELRQDSWSPIEVCTFESSMLTFGKDFSLIAQQIGTKSCREVIEYYYIWKKTSKYDEWKANFI